MTYKALIFATVAGFSMCATALAQQESGKVPQRGEVEFDKIFKSIPLGDNEAIIRLSDGCAFIDGDAAKSDAKVRSANMTWSGACPFGLADGQGTFAGGNSAFQAMMWMGRSSSHKEMSADGRVVSYSVARHNGGVSAEINGVSQEYQPFDDGIGDRWKGFVRITSSVDKSSETIARNRMTCEQTVAASPELWMQDTKEAVENVKDILKDCKKIVEKKKATRHVRVIDHVIKNAAGTTTLQRKYACAFHEEEAKEATKDDSYCNNYWSAISAQIKPKVDQVIQKSQAQHDAMLAASSELRRSLPGAYQALVLAELEEEKKRKAALAASMANELPERHAKFLELALTNNKLPTAMKAPAAFQAPVDTKRTGVMVVGKSERPLGLRFDKAALELASQIPAEEITGVVTDEKFNAAYDKLKKAGAATIYVIDLSRAFTRQNYTKITSSEKKIATQSRTVRNSYYDSLTNDLRAAQQEEAAAQQAMNAGPAPMPVGMPTGRTADLFSAGLSILQSNSAAKRLTRAQQRRQSIEQQLAGTAQSKTFTDHAMIKQAWVEYNTSFEGRLALFACSTDTNMCSEKEKVVIDDQSLSAPAITAKLDPDATNFFSSGYGGDRDFTAIRKKIDFGFSGTDIGNFMTGTVQELPVATMVAFLRYSWEDASERFQKRADTTTRSKTIEADLRLIATDYANKGLEIIDQNGFVADAFAAKEEAAIAAAEQERKKNLQNLSQ